MENTEQNNVIQKQELDLLQKKVANLETALVKEIKLIKDQNDIIKKLAEAITVIFKKLAIDTQAETGKTEGEQPV